MRILSEKPASLAEISSLLKKRQKDGELTYEQSHTLEYADAFTKLDLKEAQALDRALEKLGFLTPGARSALTDILPKKEDEVKSILSREKIEASDEQVKEILKTLKGRK